MRTISRMTVGSPTVRVVAILAAIFLLIVTMAAVGISVQRLLVPIVEGGRRVDARESVAMMRNRTLSGIQEFDRAIFRFENPHVYPAGLSQDLHMHREEMRTHEFEIIKKRLSEMNGNGNMNHNPEGQDR